MNVRKGQTMSSLQSIGMLLLVTGLVTEVSAQVTVQQPAVRQFGGTGTIVVPDRGGAYFGGVSSAAAARRQYGPLRSGTTSGAEWQAGGISTHVYIHDLQAMDAALLSQGGHLAAVDNVREQQLLQRAGVSRERDSAPGGRDIHALPAQAQAERFEQLARAAESRGKAGVARLHWQMAARYGSQTAREHLQDHAASSAP